MKPAGLAIVSIFIVGAIVDTILFIKGGTEATISHEILTWSYDYPIFTFAFGILCGHLFWRTRDTKHTEQLGKGASDDK